MDFLLSKVISIFCINAVQFVSKALTKYQGVNKLRQLDNTEVASVFYRGVKMGIFNWLLRKGKRKEAVPVKRVQSPVQGETRKHTRVRKDRREDAQNAEAKKEVRRIVARITKVFDNPLGYDEGKYSEALDILKGLDSNARQSTIQKVISRMIRTFMDVQDYRAHLGAVDVLEDIGLEAVPLIIKSLKKGLQNQSIEMEMSSKMVLSWAGALYREESAPMLVELLEDKDTRVRICAADCLCCICSPDTGRLCGTFFDPSGHKTRKSQESRRVAVIQSVKDSSVDHLNKRELIDRLLWILPQHTDFLHEGLVPARQIGKRLYKLGKGVCMQDAWREIMGKPKTRDKLVDAETLDAAWYDIGGWMP